MSLYDDLNEFLSPTECEKVIEITGLEFYKRFTELVKIAGEPVKIDGQIVPFTIGKRGYIKLAQMAAGLSKK